jgi:hypothetical protein
MLKGLAVEGQPRKLRSVATNGPCRLAGVDMRRAAGRRYLNLVDQLVSQFGDANLEAVRELAGLRFSLEQCQARVVNGDARAREDLVRLFNLIGRREKVLRDVRRTEAKRPALVTLQQHFAKRSAERARKGPAGEG